ncbi:aspartate/tyrosine/aromatic aminotransferase [Bradyrhizobium sp. U87765 SZCCT0131]|uniref:amino acid aminotransferase n=1 Tax=unclassified Bradyrhizobium TaxID=2631580 RepID=UPI001BA91B54|nr:MULTISPECIES: amino acid aminotransferase [unclassified Bradyrhizobium]MBR1218434.1 aspartate/tyrosine/aromatic aminotransferase [Bradyrhizobium sp. U87765 SZCCT0131]MBR1260620.1 aspartate/tyrosine/aromatic aminotransferase [Bradyrhizobium sp. U87765 SZCCT0134]MBR1303932.1 aspartate/tyrosine/aromatic aminotransferase [Bradyrhizobium sp. U87765 SZCCT0110]MBR1319538.1 aspartate/tyrosine/aromatic aminotransferase [Bradyrhizobium sp. U87765 SZCCT0109]MBR1347863.1 aspartate/tyrosine/aromatic ami
MFDALKLQPADPLLALIGLFRSDPRPNKIDLGVGVYRDEAGDTPVLRAVKAAERQLWETQDTKSYVAPEGDRVFLDRLWQLVAGNGRFAVGGVQTPGGSGALRLATDLLKVSGVKRIWLGLPTWPNHNGIFNAAGLPIESYRFFDCDTQTMLFDESLTALNRADPGDAALLHACCHNPTGARLSPAQWGEIADVLSRRGIVPLIDLAYQGLGEGIEQDAAGLRRVIAAVPEALVAVSGSKSFGLYRERTGAIFAVGRSQAEADAAQSNLVSLARASYSMPPDHGAAIVSTILGDAVLRQQWSDELDEMRVRLAGIRRGLAEGLRETWQPAAAIADQDGLFSLLPLSEAQVLDLRERYGIYMPASGRINIAGLKTSQVPDAVAAFAALRR